MSKKNIQKQTSGAAPALIQESSSDPNFDHLQKVMDSIAEKAILKFIKSDKVLTQSQLVYIMTKKLGDTFIKSLKPYLCQQMKYILSKCQKINEGKQYKKLMAWRTFEDLIEEFRDLHKNKHNRPDIWDTLSWLGYSACGGIQGCLLQVDKKKLSVKESPSRKKNSTKKGITLHFWKKTEKKTKYLNYKKYVSNYHVGIRMFLYQFIVLLDRCKTDQLIEDIKNSFKPIYTSKSKAIKDQLELTMENFRSLVKIKISDPNASIDSEILVKLLDLANKDKDEFNKIEDLAYLVEKLNNLIPT